MDPRPIPARRPSRVHPSNPTELSPGEGGARVAGPRPVVSRRRRSLARRMVYRLLAPVAELLVRTLGRTWRLRGDVSAGDGAALERALARGPVILAVFHDQVVPAALHLLERFDRAERPVAFLVSPSVDGDLVTRILEASGARVARGSATRSGLRALRGLHRLLVREQASPLIAVDGPQGPPHRPKSGALLLARLARAPLIPIAVAPRRALRLPTWDRLQVPLPFTRLGVAIGEPLVVAEDAQGPALESLLEELAARLQLAVARAAALAGP